ncbi:MAG: hypothetical protein WBP55_03935 [Solirubrobacterales bacterium]
MNDQRNRDTDDGNRLQEPDSGRAPGGLTWPIRRAYWFVEKYFLWPISDSFKRMAAAFSRGFRYRSPMAYIGATMLLTLTGAAIAAAFYFHNEAKNPEVPLTAEVPLESGNVIAATPVPVPDLPTTPPSEAKDDDTLKGVVPDFDKASGDTNKKSGNGSNTQSKNSKKKKLPDTVVTPAKTPDSPPLKVAQNFAETFVDYEIGKKGVAGEFSETATRKLSRELKADPPRQPSNGDIPKATVMNVVKGARKGKTLDVSVSLMRSGATSELRLALLAGKKNRWLVSEVRG